MKIIDISMTIQNDMMVYKNNPDKKPVMKTMHDFSNSSAYGSQLLIDLHCGTHLDMPLHMIPNGKTTDELNLEPLIGGCQVIDMTQVQSGITKEDLVGWGIEKNDFILLKTRNSFENTFNSEFIYLEKTGAEYLAQLQIRGVGIDGLGIERNQPNHETHLELLKEDIVIIEGLRLAHVAVGRYQLIALPLKIAGAEASLVRAILIEEAIH